MDPTRRKITKIARAATRYAAGALKSRGIGTSEYECLQNVRKHEGINQEQISELMNVDKAAVTRMLNNLVKKGYVVREQNPTDKRCNNIYPTDKALSVKIDETGAESRFYEWLMDGISPDELLPFLTVLDKLYSKSKAEWLEEDFNNVKEWEAKRINDSGRKKQGGIDAC